MRLSHDTSSAGPSATPIYDALYAEYSRLFRTLPGDRSGEEELRFEGFGTVHGTGTGQWGSGSWRGGGTGSTSHEALPRRGGHTPPALPPGRREGGRGGGGTRGGNTYGR